MSTQTPHAPTPGTHLLRRSLLILVPLVGLGLAGCKSTHGTGRWSSEVVLRAGEKLGGCAAGDVLPDRPGTELVAVGASGAVYVAWRQDGAWHHEKVWQAGGELIQVAVGDVDPDRPGDEIVAVGMVQGPESSDGPGAACWVYRDTDGFHGAQVFQDQKLLHGVGIHAGTPVVAGFSNKAFALARSRDAAPWRASPTLDLPGAGKTLAPTANGFAVACADGSLAWIRIGGDTGGDDGLGGAGGSPVWMTAVFDQRPVGRARVGVDASGRVICADDDGTLAIVPPEGQRQVIHKEQKKLRGAVLADLDPDSPGAEAACAGYENKITVLYPPAPDAKGAAATWRKAVVFESTGRLHHLVAAELNGKPGLELVACGYAGELVVVSRQ